MSPRTKQQNELNREQRKQEILRAAIRVYVAKGIRPVQVFANQVGMTFLPAYTFYGANKATNDQIERSALRYVEHIISADLNPIVVRKRMLNEMRQANPAL